MIWQGIQSFLSFFSELFKTFRRPEEVRKERAEEKAPVFAQKQRRKFFNRAWDFVRRRKKVERKAKRKGLDDDLKEELKSTHDNGKP